MGFEKVATLELYLWIVFKQKTMASERFDLLVDDVPYSFTATPFTYNTETRYKVMYDGVEHIFTWDSSLGRLAPINDDSSTLPVGLEEAIAERLQNSRQI